MKDPDIFIDYQREPDRGFRYFPLSVVRWFARLWRHHISPCCLSFLTDSGRQPATYGAITPDGAYERGAALQQVTADRRASRMSIVHADRIHQPVN